MLIVNAEIQIPDTEIAFSFIRSSGPGGQNVNKVNSKAVLCWNIMESRCLPAGVRARFLECFGSRLTNDGRVIIASDRYRDQTRNREDCLEKLREMLLKVAVPPRPRKKTRPSRSSVERAMKKNRRHSEKKQSRRRVRFD